MGNRRSEEKRERRVNAEETEGWRKVKKAVERLIKEGKSVNEEEKDWREGNLKG